MVSESGVLYIGMTNSMERRVNEHKSGTVDGFTKKYRCKRLVYVEEYADVLEAIAREKQLKKWSRKKKEWLVVRQNPEWRDLGGEW